MFAKHLRKNFKIVCRTFLFSSTYIYVYLTTDNNTLARILRDTFCGEIHERAIEKTRIAHLLLKTCNSAITILETEGAR